ncbi:MAG TPA: hypothetical protein PL010_03270 [Flavobacteriales bacterium]|nr:hypothetical protein [Flavobacteriales bacterium]HNE79875.1 hypothetical protein [Flavobacteriales bacterium]HNI03627.1 hypothetical protein [Flavobacteriales bacterium]
MTILALGCTSNMWAQGEVIRLEPRILLDGCYVASAGLMHDSLRTKQLIPEEEPFSALGYFHVGGGGGEQILPGVLNVEGPDAIVDWVVVELREAAANGFRVATQSALLQRDGDVVGMDGFSAIVFDVPNDFYFLSIKHRNHLGVMTSSAYYFGPDALPLDFTALATPVWGVLGRRFVDSRALLWCGDANGNGQVKYTGNGNDRDQILSLVGGTSPNVSLTGYYRQDVNMDGRVRYTGTGNDRDRILTTIGGTMPNATRTGQVP